MLYLVPTPIGNLEDISQLALRVLGEVRAVFCEDTRRTKALLSHFAIRTTVIRYRDQDERGIGRILDRLQSGEDLALVSDSGMPVISDPGVRLVSRAREMGIPVCPLPGPSAVATAVAGSGLPGGAFVFLGFLSRSASKQRRALESAAALGKSIVVYESPFRVVSLLEAAEAALGEEAQAVACRELSKLHEEWLTGTVRELRETLGKRKELLGEFILVFHPKKRKAGPSSSSSPAGPSS